ncbi:hypothetical protein D0Z07_0384 [Hyphodiscus hymeniophilus]|uniref:VOC domain-containing protein n=1 Tax=Hyphodiscus hymeniophilus TaxID=353542 RepID=A0A9P7B126_9HELO|nr:hypothetical protein D0Z07_0384 [Hyphodiscus hymeniophilus]
MPIAHTTLLVSDLAASKAFYTTALAPLGYIVALEFPGTVGFGTPLGIDFWLKDTEGVKVPRIHLAFAGTSEKQVDGFHAAALTMRGNEADAGAYRKAGATCNGPPGLRPQYAPNYYGGFVKDLDGHNMECVHFKPE